MNQILYDPYSSGFSVLLLAFVLVSLGVLIFGAVSSGLAKLGFSPVEAMVVLLVSFLGSNINIPVGQVESTVALAGPRLVRVNGMLYRIPSHSFFSHETIIALNLGGAIIPLLICGYLALRFPKSLPPALIATVPVAVAVHALARLVPGLGVVLPAFWPPLFAAGAALFVTLVVGGDETDCFVTAYFSGTMGTLIGADLLNLGRIGSLGAPLASIGGAGTFDGVFLAGILAVLLVMIPANLFRPNRPVLEPP